MNMAELIAIASIRSGKTRGELAAEMGHAYQSKITRLAKGLTTPSASEVVFFAEKAGVNPWETLAEIEATNNPQFAAAWSAALGHSIKNAIKH